jgi:16S rRNA processing protein RimM
VFGVRGEVRLFLHHRESDLFAQWRDAVLIAPSGARYGVRLRAREGAGKRVLGAFEGVQGRNEVEGLKDWRLVIPEAELPRLEDDEFYLRDVVGAEVVVGDTVVGKVVQVHETQSADILEVDVGADSSAFVPCLEEFVVSIEPGRVELTPDALEEG